MAALATLLSAAGMVEAFRLSALRNPDIWWHLRTGVWIMQSHALPRHALFSQYADLRWVDPGWAFDSLAALAYRFLGLQAIPGLLVIFRVAMAVVTFLLVRTQRASFWWAVALSAIAQYVMVDLQPTGSALSILFFGLELMILLYSRRRGSMPPLLWMPLLFLLWANLDNQFVVGLALLGLLVAAEAIEHILGRAGVRQVSSTALPLGKVAAAAGCSVAATLVTPYGSRVLVEAVEYTYSKVLLSNLADMHPMAFRRPQDFVVALLAMAALFCLGRSRSLDLFKLLTMSAVLVLGFRVRRDTAFLVMAAVAVLADALADQRHGSALQNRGRGSWEKPLIAAMSLAAITAAMIRVPKPELLNDAVRRVFPVKACDYIRANRLPAPLFNAYDWGGFLIWYLPEYPVAIDGRVSLYGNEGNERYFSVTTSVRRLQTEPVFTGARTVLLERGSELAEALTRLPALRARYRVVYQDDIAVVLLRD